MPEADRQLAAAAMTIALRAVDETDRPLLEALYASVRGPELEMLTWSEEQKAAFLRQQFDAQDRDYRGRFLDAAFDLIVVDGEAAGRLYVDRRADELHVADISLLPSHRGRGIGTVLLERLQSEAAASGRSVSLHVEAFNPAQRLYQRLGFELVEADAVYLRMRWSPAAHLAGTG